MKRFFWPDIDNFEDAKKITRGGATVSFFVALVTGIVTFLETNGYTKLFGLGPEAYIDAGLFFIIGIGILFYSRIAALAGLLLYLFAQYQMMQSGNSRFSIMALYFTLVYINALRAAFDYHQFKKIEAKEKAGPKGPVSILTGQAVPDETAVSETPEKPAKRPLSKLITGVTFGVILLAVSGVLAIFLLKKPALPSASSSSSRDSASTQMTSAPQTAGSKTFRMKNGETYRGDILMEDPEFFVIKSGAKEEVLARKEIASIE